MLHPISIPIIFLAFADAKQYGHLPNLSPEYNALFDLLLPLKKARQLDLLREYHSENKTIPKRLAEFKDQIHIFHYSGHADGKHLYFNGQAGHSAGLAELLALQQSLKLVFLNGCRSQAQAEQYIVAGVPAVLATTTVINDNEALAFAENFYRALANRHSILEAFKAARGALKAASEKYHGLEEEVTILRGADFGSAFKNSLPWRLYVKAGQEAILDWVIPEMVPQEHTVTLLVANSETYQQIRKKIEGLEQQIREKREQVQAFPFPLPEALAPVLKSLEVEQINLGNVLEEAQGQERQFKEGVIKLAETFKRIELNTERLKKAKTHFDANEYDKARVVLREEEMQAELDVLLKQKKQFQSQASENEQNLRDKANEFLILAKITAVNFELPARFEKAKAYFEQSLRAWETEENLFAFAYFLDKHNQIQSAYFYYEKVLYQYRKLAKSKPQDFLPYVAMTLNNLGLLQCKKNEFSQAERSYEEVLTIYRKLTESNPQYYLPLLAICLNNLGFLQLEKNEFSQAGNSFEEALAIYRKLAESNPQVFLPYVAMTLNNLGLLQGKKNEFSQAESSYEEALAIFESNHQNYLPHLAMTFDNLGILKHARNEYLAAENSYKSALLIRQKLAESNPHTYLPNVATTLNNLAVLLKAKNEYSAAGSSYEAALLIRRKLAESNPQTYLPDVAMTLNNLANLQRARNEYLIAENYYEESLLIRRKLAESNPQTYLPYVAMTLNDLGILQRVKNEYSVAESYYEEALEIRRKLADSNPQTYLPDVAMTLNNLANVQYDKGQFYEAERFNEEGLTIYQKLAEADPQTYLPYVAMASNNLANLHCANKEFSAAESSYEEALEIYRKLTLTDPQVYLPNLVMIQINMSVLYQESIPDRSRSLGLVKEAVQNLEGFKDIPYIQNYLKMAYQILEEWGVQLEELFEEE